MSLDFSIIIQSHICKQVILIIKNNICHVLILVPVLFSYYLCLMFPPQFQPLAHLWLFGSCNTYKYMPHTIHHQAQLIEQSKYNRSLVFQLPPPFTESLCERGDRSLSLCLPLSSSLRVTHRAQEAAEIHAIKDVRAKFFQH